MQAGHWRGFGGSFMPPRRRKLVSCLIVMQDSHKTKFKSSQQMSHRPCTLLAGFQGSISKCLVCSVLHGKIWHFLNQFLIPPSRKLNCQHLENIENRSASFSVVGLLLCSSGKPLYFLRKATNMQENEAFRLL